MAAETSDFDRLLQVPQVPPGRRPLSPRMVWPHLRALQPEEEAPLQTRCRSSGPSYIGQPQAVDGPARLLALRTGGGNSILGPLGDQAPLEMRDRSEDMKNQLAGGRVRVDPFLQAARRRSAASPARWCGSGSYGSGARSTQVADEALQTERSYLEVHRCTSIQLALRRLARA